MSGPGPLPLDHEELQQAVAERFRQGAGGQDGRAHQVCGAARRLDAEQQRACCAFLLTSMCPEHPVDASRAAIGLDSSSLCVCQAGDVDT